MANNNLLTISFLPNSHANTTTVTLIQTSTVSNSYATSVQTAYNIIKNGAFTDDSAVVWNSDAVASIVIS